MRPTISLMFLATVLFAGSALADADHEAVLERIGSLVPDAEDVTIAETPVPGVLEVRVGSEVIYMSNDGRYLLQGRMFDLETQTDLTDQARTSLRKEAMSKLDDIGIISFSPDNPEHNIYVFTDIDCGYCRRMHAQIDEYKEHGIAVHYLLFPRAGPGSGSWAKAEAVWCADDQQDALTIAKLGQEPDRLECDNPVQGQYQLGQEMGVTGTPALLTESGVLIPGFVQAAQLKERLVALEEAEG